MLRTFVAGCAAVVLCGLAGLVGAGTASADQYRYWSYWRSTGKAWTYANTGPASYRPKDGTVDGWRFTAAQEQRAAKPRTAPDFDRICAGIRIKDGYKRVGLVVDYGTAADAPADAKRPKTEPVTKCVVVPVSATSADVLDQQRRTRLASSGLLCAIDGYPAKGCGETVDESGTATPSQSSSGSGGSGDGGGTSTTYLAVGAGLVIAVALVVAMTARRRREGSGS